MGVPARVVGFMGGDARATRFFLFIPMGIPALAAGLFPPASASAEHPLENGADMFGVITEIEQSLDRRFAKVGLHL